MFYLLAFSFRASLSTRYLLSATGERSKVMSKEESPRRMTRALQLGEVSCYDSLVHTDFVSVYISRTSWPISRPHPDCL